MTIIQIYFVGFFLGIILSVIVITNIIKYNKIERKRLAEERYQRKVKYLKNNPQKIHVHPLFWHPDYEVDKDGPII